MIKLNSCYDINYISLLVITVKRYQSVKPALDSKISNRFIHEKTSANRSHYQICRGFCCCHKKLQSGLDCSNLYKNVTVNLLIRAN